jgi:hypothetical protein
MDMDPLKPYLDAFAKTDEGGPVVEFLYPTYHGVTGLGPTAARYGLPVRSSRSMGFLEDWLREDERESIESFSESD